MVSDEPVRLFPSSIPTLAERCRIHAEKMEGEGWHVTAGVLWEIAATHDELLAALKPIIAGALGLKHRADHGVTIHLTAAEINAGADAIAKTESPSPAA